MLPLFRVLPVGGVFLAIAILLLALTPPRGRILHVPPDQEAPRGALLDRAEHPEWRQFLIHAAFRRTEAVAQLRDLRDTPIVAKLPPPVTVRLNVAAFSPIPKASASPSTVEAMPPAAHPTPGEPTFAAVTQAPAASAKHEVAQPIATAQPEPKLPETVTVAKANAARQPPKVVAKAASTSNEVVRRPVASGGPPLVKPKVTADTPETSKLKPKATADKTEMVKPEPAKSVAAKQTASPKADADNAEQSGGMPTNGGVDKRAANTIESKIEPAAVQHPNKSGSVHAKNVTAPPRDPTATARKAPDTAGAQHPDAVKVAALSETPSEDVTGSVDNMKTGTTIPVGIGEASSTEIIVMLPRERPPVLKRLDQRRTSRPVRRSRRYRHRVYRVQHTEKPTPRNPFAFIDDWQTNWKVRTPTAPARAPRSSRR